MKNAYITCPVPHWGLFFNYEEENTMEHTYKSIVEWILNAVKACMHSKMFWGFIAGFIACAMFF